jgi:threonine dehydratase
MVQVTEDAIAEAIRIYFDDAHQVAEGAGAAALAPNIPAVPEYYKASEYWSKASLERRALLQARARNQL